MSDEALLCFINLLHFACIRSGRESAHLLESAHNGLAMSHIPPTSLPFFSSPLSFTSLHLTDKIKTAEKLFQSRSCLAGSVFV